ncbi:MAG: hypothetical protein WBQ71_00770 [Trebonia sp.]
MSSLLHSALMGMYGSSCRGGSASDSVSPEAGEPAAGCPGRRGLLQGGKGHGRAPLDCGRALRGGWCRACICHSPDGALDLGDFLRFQDGDGAARGVGCLVGGFVMRVQVAVLSAGSSARARAAD